MKPELVFTFPSCLGGVASFNFNIINNSALIRGFRSKVILLKAEEDTRPEFEDKFNADEVVKFSYSHKENQYCVLKRLKTLLGEGEGAIVTDNALTVKAAAMFGSPKTVFHLLHDYYYVNENIALGDLVDAAVAHSSFFSDAVFSSSPDVFGGRTFYIPYGVKQCDSMPVKLSGGPLRLVFLGRLDKGKGVHLLFDIEQMLTEKGVEVEWTIIGRGPLKSFLTEQWKGRTNVRFEEPASTDDVYAALSGQDIFVFPTTFEGTPVSILETMSNGIVVITNDLPGGIRDTVLADTGFRCEVGNLRTFSEIIRTLDVDRSKLARMQLASYEYARSNFDIARNADRYYHLFSRYGELRRTRKEAVVKMSRLDRSFIPNALVRLLRANT